jgi:hypothetical protein
VRAVLDGPSLIVLIVALAVAGSLAFAVADRDHG